MASRYIFLILQYNKKIKVMLEFKERKKVINKLRLSMWVGIVIGLTIITLCIIGTLTPIGLLSLPILFIVVKNQRRLLSIELAVYTFQRYLLDEEFHKEFNEKNNIK